VIIIDPVRSSIDPSRKTVYDFFIEIFLFLQTILKCFAQFHNFPLFIFETLRCVVEIFTTLLSKYHDGGEEGRRTTGRRPQPIRGPVYADEKSNLLNELSSRWPVACDVTAGGSTY